MSTLDPAIARERLGLTYQPAWRRPIASVFRRSARAAVRFCVRHGVHPDAISYLSIVASGVAALCFRGSGTSPLLLIVAPLLCYVRLWLNMLDGMVALESNQASARGEILNDLPDRISDVLIFAGVAHSGLASPYSGYWAAIFALLTAYVGTLGQAVGVQREFSGVMAKPWRMVVLHAGAWLALAAGAPGVTNAGGEITILDWTCIAIVAGCLQTIAVRLHRILTALQALPPKGGSHEIGFNAGLLPSDGRENRACVERSISTWDGATLFYRAWLPASPSDKALVLFHRGHEHSGRWQEVVDVLGLDDVAIFAWDARGHGRSSGDRGAADSVATLVKDADAFASHITSEYGIATENMIVMGHSVGAVIAAAWVHDYAPPLRGMVLATPAFRVKLYVPGAVPLLRLREMLFGGGFVKSYVKAQLLTHDTAEAERYKRDPHIFRQIAVNMLLDLHDTSLRLIADAGAIHTPALILAAGNDWVVRLDAQQRFFERLSSPVKAMQVLPGFFHAIFHERDRHLPVAAVRTFVTERFADCAPGPSLMTSDKGGPTKAEHDRLCAPGGRRYIPLKWALKTIGRLSEGMRLGWGAGFDSGVTLDYVYENRPRGITPVGRLIDWAFLSSIGWRGIRQRRIHIERLLRDAIGRVHAARRPAHLLDIAAGPGRYVLETLRSAPQPVTALLRDTRAENIEAGRELSTRLGVRGISFAQGDAFDAHSIATTRPRPNIAIVSGLYELFPDNAPVAASLQGLADAVEPGGYLVYTNQPWHPQLELIARTLTNRDGRPWIMRRRTQAEIDQLVRAAGFRKLSMEIDRWGIFTVSLAQRVAA